MVYAQFRTFLRIFGRFVVCAEVAARCGKVRTVAVGCGKVRQTLRHIEPAIDLFRWQL